MLRRSEDRLVTFDGALHLPDLMRLVDCRSSLAANGIETVLGTMRLLMAGVIFLGIGFSATAQDMPGVAVGKSAPTFQARDQFGKEQTISSLMGRNGLVLVFFRSADW
jgi:hypothetical protein